MKEDDINKGQSTTPYRVLHCIDNLGRGGAESQLVQTLQNSDKTRFKNYVCYLHSPDDLKEAVLTSDSIVFNLNIGNKRNFIQAIRRIRKLVREYNIDLIHASTPYSNVYAPLAGLLEHVPVVFTLTTTHDAKIHAQIRSDFLRRIRVYIFFMWRAILLRLTKARIIAVSKTVKDSAIRHLKLPAERIELVYRGLLIENYEPNRLTEGIVEKAKQEFGISDSYPILINVGRLWPVKGQEDIIHAMPAIIKKFPQAKLLIVGEGPLGGELKELCNKLTLQDYVKFLGLRNDVPQLLAMSDIYVAASYLEGLPNTIVEAMAAKKPVVTYDIPVCREVLDDGRGEAGIFVKERDPELLAKGVIRLAMDTKSMVDMANKGLQKVRDSFDIRKNTRILESIYEDILSGNRSSYDNQLTRY